MFSGNRIRFPFPSGKDNHDANCIFSPLLHVGKNSFSLSLFSCSFFSTLEQSIPSSETDSSSASLHSSLLQSSSVCLLICLGVDIIKGPDEIPERSSKFIDVFVDSCKTFPLFSGLDCFFLGA